MTRTELKAPLDGFIFPLEQVPDPVFSQKMVGDGISIDPTGQVLCAPCDGVVLQLHHAGHAVTLSTADGLELMMHIGLDTVQLKGRGFTPLVKEGQLVTAGEALIEFDADFLAINAKSLLTQVLVTNSERVTRFLPESGYVQAGRDLLLTLELSEAQLEPDMMVGKMIASEAIIVPNTTGLHARPAAVLAKLAKKFQSRIFLQRGDDKANARSVVGIMGLEVLYQDKVQLCAQGPDAQQAIDTISPQLLAGLGDEGTRPAPAPATTGISADAAPAPHPHSGDPDLLLGVAASPGLGVGKVFQFRRRQIQFEETGESPNRERRRLDDALDQARVQLEALEAELHAQADTAKAAIFSAHQELLDEPALQSAGVTGVMRFEEGVVHLLLGLNADQYAAEMRGALA